MKEIEIKILDINVEKIRTKLLNLGAEKTFEDIHAVFFDSPRNKLKNQGNTLRVRKIGEKTELCFKGTKEDSPFKIRPKNKVITNNCVKKLGFSTAETSNLSSGEVIKLYNEQKN